VINVLIKQSFVFLSLEKCKQNRKLSSKILSKIGQKKRIAGKKNKWKKSKIGASLMSMQLQKEMKSNPKQPSFKTVFCPKKAIVKKEGDGHEMTVIVG